MLYETSHRKLAIFTKECSDQGQIGLVLIKIFGGLKSLIQNLRFDKYLVFKLL
ncbi:hypothetical protein A8938_3415 [Algoriphagus zhangzhouensis]|uniref:Uncharacterized protein n=1 Tax=Algoriphagus zhangzhouensis TaxID=1073327 RepID=A0A1M7ZHM9_9BACT|nr:hypothetical protein A8938_3415 [Algoriphagus zhangzhouensis]SHO64377.1 hypothetical protein SAMN04488108_3411 [Algoriphagus zhangzhouensis]